VAKDEILRAGKASASLLQRRLKVGYARAARLLDLLEQEGFIGPADGAKPREILKADLGSDEPLPSSPPAPPSEDQLL
jgi:S-DNA-T family DNA segregation ATPase FtsK/SpoIIIE